MCWSFPLILSLTDQTDDFRKLHNELLCRILPALNFGHGNQAVKEATQGFTSSEIHSAFTTKRRIGTFFPSIRITVLYDRQNGKTQKPSLQKGDLITGKPLNLFISLY